MDEIADRLGVESIEPGSNVLVLGPPLIGKQELGLEFLEAGARDGQASLVVTTKDDADRLLEEFDTRLPAQNTDGIGIIDTVTAQQGTVREGDDERVRYASSPGDLTEIGISLTQFLEQFDESGWSGTRVMLHSISTLLMYAELRTVFRFLHVFTGRVRGADAIGLYTMDTGAHDPDAINTIKPLFDDAIKIEDSHS